MKTVKNCLVFSFISTVAFIHGAVDAEFASLSKARENGMRYKMQEGELVAKLKHVVGTDTELLLKSITAGDNTDYVAFAKEGIIALINPWIDSLDIKRAPKARFLTTTIPVASLGPTTASKNGAPDRSITSFKEGLAIIINAFNPITVAPGDANISTLKATKTAVMAEFVVEVHRWIDTLMADGQFLENAINASNPTKPGDRSRAEFKAKIKTLIETF